MNDFAYDLLEELIDKDRVVRMPKLFIELTGDHISALFLSQCLYWSSRTTRTDGFFWKSDKEWEDELMLTKWQRQRSTRDLVALGVLETKLEKAMGAPTNHYRINKQALVEKIRELLDRRKNGQSIEEKMVERSTNNSSNINIDVDIDVDTISITTSSTDADDVPIEKPLRKERQPRAKRTPKPNTVEVSPEASELYELSRSFFNRSIATKSWFEFILREYGRKRVMVALKIGRLAGIPNSAYIGRIIARLTDDELKKYDDDGNEAKQVAPGRKFTDEEIERRLRERNKGTWLEQTR